MPPTRRHRRPLTTTSTAPPPAPAAPAGGLAGLGWDAGWDATSHAAGGSAPDAVPGRVARANADEGLDRTFADVAELGERCRFRDCAHRGEPDCAVAAAVADGVLSQRRVDSYRTLQRENAWLRGRYDARLRAEQRRAWRALSRAARSARQRRLPG